MTTSSPDAAEEEQFCLMQANIEYEIEEHTLEKIEQSWTNANDLVAHEEQSSLTTSVKQFT